MGCPPHDADAMPGPMSVGGVRAAPLSLHRDNKSLDGTEAYVEGGGGLTKCALVWRISLIVLGFIPGGWGVVCLRTEGGRLQMQSNVKGV